MSSRRLCSRNVRWRNEILCFNLFTINLQNLSRWHRPQVWRFQPCDNQEKASQSWVSMAGNGIIVSGVSIIPWTCKERSILRWVLYSYDTAHHHSVSCNDWYHAVLSIHPCSTDSVYVYRCYLLTYSQMCIYAGISSRARQIFVLPVCYMLMCTTIPIFLG